MIISRQKSSLYSVDSSFRWEEHAESGGLSMNESLDKINVVLTGKLR